MNTKGKPLKSTLKFHHHLLHLILITGIILVTVGGATEAAAKIYWNHRIYPGVKVLNLDLGNKTQAEAQSYLETKLGHYQPTLSVNRKNYHLTPQTDGIDYNIPATVAIALSYGRSNWFAAGELVSAKTAQLPVYQVDLDKFKRFNTQISADFNQKPVDATVQIQAGQPIITSDKPGKGISSAQLLTALKQGANLGSSHLELVPQSLAAKIKAGDLSTTVASAQEILAKSINLTYNNQVFYPKCNRYWCLVSLCQQPPIIKVKPAWIRPR